MLPYRPPRLANPRGCHRCAGESKLLAASVRPVVVVWKRGYTLLARRRTVERAAFGSSGVPQRWPLPEASLPGCGPEGKVAAPGQR